MFPRITIGILNYNKKNLHEAIECAKKQTYLNLEFLVVDNGSFVKPEMEYGVNYYFLEGNRGVAAGRNAVMAAALSEWVYMLDADDLIVPHAITTIYNVMTGFEDIIVPNTKEPLISGAIKFNNYLPYSALISKTAWRLNGNYEQVGEYNIEDWDFWIKASVNPNIRVKTIPDELFIHRFESNSVSLRYSDPAVFYPISQAIKEKHRYLYE